jgi:hypothetical protein
MDIIIARERQEGFNIYNRLSQSETYRQIFNITNDNETETLILPVVPPELVFPKDSDITNLKGVMTQHNIPSESNLQTITIDSIFPVNKDYSWQNRHSNVNGFDYVDFFIERQNNQLPFRLIAFDWDFSAEMLIDEYNVTRNNDWQFDTQENGQELFRVHADNFYVVKKFDYKVDKVGDINYTLIINQFNEETFEFPINWTQTLGNLTQNTSTRFALRKFGLI